MAWPSLVLLSLLASSSALAFTSPAGSHTAPSNYVPNTFFIQTDGSTASLSKRGLSPFEALNRTLAAVASHGILYDVRQRFTDLPDVFHGASIKVDEGTTLDDLLSIEGVTNAWPVRLLSRPIEPVVSDATTLLNSTYSSLQSLLSSATPPASAYQGETYYPHVQTGIAPLHNAGFLGEGVKIAVIDDGVDYTNPILGGCFGEGCHISFGYAFANDDYDGTNTPIPSSDPYSSCSSHGTHVTGIIGSLANELGFSGVAPAATLGHYRVLGCSGSAGEDLIVAAMMRAYNEGADVISMSIAGGIGWTDLNPSQILTEYLSKQGVHVVAAGGNERTEGLFFTDTPAATKLGTVVGAVDTTYYPAFNAVLNGGRDPIPYTSPTPLNLTGSYGVYFTSTNTSISNDGCSDFSDSAPNLSNTIVVIERGTCDFAVKIANAAAAGAKGVLIYNSEGSLSIPQLNAGTNGPDGVGSLRYEEGIRLLSYYLADPTGLRISFPFGKLVPGVVDNVSGGTVAYYSNYGPTNELYMYPTLVAPGTNILSTVPGGVALMRGSSMATPYHAGSVAVLLSARKSDNLTPAQVKGIFQTTTTFAPVEYGSDSYDTIISQGAGVINVNRAFGARTFISPSQLLFNDTLHLNRTQTMTFTNRNSWPVMYQLSWTDAAGIVTYNDGASNDIIPSTTPDYDDTSVIRIAFSSRYVLVPARSTGSVRVTVNPPNLLPEERDRFPFYSGWVTVNGQGQGAGRARKESYTVPFMGLAAAMYDMPVIDRTDVALGAFLPFVANADIQTGPAVYTAADPPVVYWRLGAGSRRLNLDLVEADIEFNATIETVTNGPFERLVRRSASELAKRATTPTLYSDVPLVGHIYSPFQAPARDYLLNFSPYASSDYEIPFTGQYNATTGGTATIEVGKSYRFLLRALKITGNPLLSSDYESWLSPPVSFSSV
ncbi:hypothetical protein JCM8547_002761 [Rhodosporidiobolus lusitaniae]